MHSILKVFVACSVLLVVCSAWAQQGSQTRVIHADLSHVTGPHSSVPLLVVGAGRASEGLRADWQEQLATLQNEIGFHYLRMHGLLCDEMGVYNEDKKGNPEFNFQYVDSLYDALLKMHIRPFVELRGLPRRAGKKATGRRPLAGGAESFARRRTLKQFSICRQRRGKIC
jgi:xylan 1,4-beta-xylosidase